MDRDQQIQLDFLEEAQEYFDNLESILLDLDSQEVNIELLDKAMRAAHSLKGGAAMMGFTSLNKIAHRLEDFLKILRVRKDADLLDREVTTLLLQGVDCLREVGKAHKSQNLVDEQWIAQITAPVFDPLYQRLGDLKEEDEDSLLAEEEAVDVSNLVFETGVEECLDSLEPKLDNLNPQQLRLELASSCEELADFGLMSGLDAFVSLCQSVQARLATVSDQGIRDLAYQAFNTWQRSHALVTLGRLDQIPQDLPSTEIENLTTEDNQDLSNLEELDFSEVDQLQDLSNLEELDFSEVDQLQDLLALELQSTDQTIIEDSSKIEELEPTELATSTVDWEQMNPDLDELADLQATFDNLEPQAEVTAAESTMVDWDQLTPDLDELADLQATFDNLEPQAEVTETETESIASEQVAEAVPKPTVHSPKPSVSERMVKVSAQKLQKINVLSSKLILERNSAILRLNQLHNYLELTKERIRTLEKSTSQIRKCYDWASLEGMLPKFNQPNEELTEGSSPWQSSESAQQEFDEVEAGSVISGRSTFDALEMDRYSDLHLMFQEQIETIFQLQEVTTDIDLGLQEMSQVVRDFSYTTRELQQNVTRSQMRPFADVVSRFPRFIRDLSLKHNKQVNLKIEGETTPIDRQVLEQLIDPLNHLLRNAFDHGIEEPSVRLAQGKPAEGTILLRAMQKGNKTIIIIEDDGKGIDEQKIRDRFCQMGLPKAQVEQIPTAEILQAIFEPGFSTAERVTELSGRGVGMDVVRSNLQQVRGDIQVETNLGKGTKFTITVPLSLLILRVNILESAGMVFAVPVHSIQEMIRFEDDLVTKDRDLEQVNWNDLTIPLIRLEQWLTFNRPSRSFQMDSKPTIDTPTVLVFSQENQWNGIYIERYWGEQEVAIRSVVSPINLSPGFTGSTILGDGRVIPLIEPSFLGDWIAKTRKSSETLANDSDTAHPQSNYFNIDNPTILIVDDSVNVRRYLASILERNGYQVEQAKDGREAVDKLVSGLEVQAVICDVEMPRLDGYGVLTEVRSHAKFAKLPIAMLTSRNNDKHRKLAMKLGASEYLSKPLDEPGLLNILQKYIVNQ
ncbi:MAG: hybrid sensor histidine kinase/response regulator [Xenococcus sp. MO_188.B8]|nr:hybrid sensor histidine kinase/response regulator [Xenococcus sp. MO_188.B8]